MQNTLIIVAILLLLLGSNLAITANAQDLIDPTPSPPVVHDLDGNLLDQVTIGQQVVLSKTFVNDMNDNQQPFVALFEVRDSDGVTVYLAWQRGIMTTEANVGISWIADSIGVYEIRTFAISDFTNTIVLDAVETRSIHVIEDAGT